MGKEKRDVRKQLSLKKSTVVKADKLIVVEGASSFNHLVENLIENKATEKGVE